MNADDVEASDLPEVLDRAPTPAEVSQRSVERDQLLQDPARPDPDQPGQGSGPAGEAGVGAQGVKGTDIPG